MDSDSDEGDCDGEEAEPWLAERAELPPFFAAIPSLAAGAAAAPKVPPQPQPPQRTQQQPRPPQPTQKSPAPTQRTQQLAAPPAPPAAPRDERPLSATAFKRQRDEFTQQLFAEFNRTVFGGRLPADLEIKWNARLLTTAGLTHYRRNIPDDPYAPPM